MIENPELEMKLKWLKNWRWNYKWNDFKNYKNSSK